MAQDSAQEPPRTPVAVGGVLMGGERMGQVLEELPRDFRVEVQPGRVWAMRRGEAERLQAAGFEPFGGAGVVSSRFHGRRPLLEFAAPTGELFLQRAFHHGGLLGSVSGERFLDPRRPFREAILSDFLTRAGVATPDVVAVGAESLGVGHRLFTVTRRVPAARDLCAVIDAEFVHESSFQSLEHIAAEAGRLVRRLHQIGFLHADLHPRNVLAEEPLLRGEEGRLWLLDLDRSQLHVRLTGEQRERNLRRFWRYFEHREVAAGRRPSALARQHFLRGYEPDAEARRELAMSIAATHARRGPWHALGRRLRRSGT